MISSVVVEGLDQEGRGVGRQGGRPVLVAGALPGETVRFRLTARRRSYDEGIVECVSDASVHRVTPPCEHFGTCGGCRFQHLDTESQIELKRQWLLDSLHRVGGVEPMEVLPPLGGPSWGYRRKARLAVAFESRRDRVIVGFRESRSPRIADIRHCPVLHSAVASLFSPLGALIGSLSVRHRVPQIEVAVGDGVGALCFRLLAAPSEDDVEALRDFGHKHGLGVFVQGNGTDVPYPLTESGPELHYTLDEFGIEIGFLPTQFVQINQAINSAMVKLVVDLLELKPDDRVLDLFCGLGNFTLPLASRAAAVVGVDVDARLIRCARRNADRNAARNAQFHAADLDDVRRSANWLAGPYDAVVLDPPRTGALGVLSHLGEAKADRILYVSCDPRTLARDAGYLVRQHGYVLARAGVIDMFPHTAHVESIALLQRS